MSTDRFAAAAEVALRIARAAAGPHRQSDFALMPPRPTEEPEMTDHEPEADAGELARLVEERELGHYGDPNDQEYRARLNRYADAMGGRATLESMADAALALADEERAAHWEKGRRHGLRQAWRPGGARVRQLESEIESMLALEEANSAAWQKQCARVRELEAENARLREETLRWAAEQIRAQPMPTALTGPYWYGQAFADAAHHLEHLADVYETGGDQ